MAQYIEQHTNYAQLVKRIKWAMENDPAQWEWALEEAVYDAHDRGDIDDIEFSYLQDRWLNDLKNSH